MSWGLTFTHFVCPNCDGFIFSKKEDAFHGPVIEEKAEYADFECGHCPNPTPIPYMALMHRVKEKRRRREIEEREG